MNKPKPTFSLVIPVYRNEGNIPALLDTIAMMNKHCNGQMEVIFVVDGSPDRSLELLQTLLPAVAFPSRLLEHSRNFGSFSAIRTGMGVASGEYLAVMAADLQEPPELVLQMFDVLASQSADVVFGERVGRDDPFFSKSATPGKAGGMQGSEPLKAV